MKPLQLLYGILGAFNGLLLVEVIVAQFTGVGIEIAVALGIAGGLVAGFAVMKLYPGERLVLRP